MTSLSHLDPNFGSVFSIEAVNEPIMDATKTPNYGDCGCALLSSQHYRLLTVCCPAVQKNFVQTIRAVEFALGVGQPFLDLSSNLRASSTNVTASLNATISGSQQVNSQVQEAILSSVPILVELSEELGFSLLLGVISGKKDPLVARQVPHFLLST